MPTSKNLSHSKNGTPDFIGQASRFSIIFFNNFSFYFFQKIDKFPLVKPISSYYNKKIFYRRVCKTMSKIVIPEGYKTPLSVYEMQRAIEFIKSNFQVNLGQALNLRRVSAPLFVDENSGLNDNLNGVERPVSFDIPDVGSNAQVVHSLAKWKRLALKKYEFNVGKGLFTDMNAIRRDEEVDNTHSIYVDQ